MADQSIALQAQAPNIDVMQPLLAFQRLKQGEESLLGQRLGNQQQQSANDEQLMRQAVAEAGDGTDPDAWTSAMDRAAARGSSTAAANRQYSPLAAQRLSRAYGGGSGPLMRGGRAQAGQPGEGGMGQGGGEDISQDPAFIQKWSGLKPDQRATMLRGFARAAQILPTVHDQASMDQMIDTLKSEGHPEAEQMRGQYSPMAVQAIHGRMQQMLQFGGDQGARGMTGAEYRAPFEDMKVGGDIVRHDLGTGGYSQVYHEEPQKADDWQFIGTTQDGKPISENRRTGEQKIGDQVIGAKPRARFSGAADEKYHLLVDVGGVDPGEAARIVGGGGGLTEQKALEIGMRTATQNEFLSGPAADKRAREIAKQLMTASPRAPAAAPRQPATVPNPTIAPRQPAPTAAPSASAAPASSSAVASAPNAAQIQHLKDNPALAPRFDEKFGPGASRKYLPAVGPQSMNTAAPNQFGEGEGMSRNPPDAMAIRSADEQNARAGLQAQANRTGQAIRNTSFGDIVPEPGTTPAQPEGISLRPGSVLSRSTPLTDLSPEQLVAASRRKANIVDDAEITPLENSRQRITEQQALAATGDFRGTPRDTYTQSRAPDALVQQDAIRSALIQRLATARSGAARLELLRQLAANEAGGTAAPVPRVATR
jgi:hypothetical protein